jgi:hypothetical protein
MATYCVEIEAPGVSRHDNVVGTYTTLESARHFGPMVLADADRLSRRFGRDVKVRRAYITEYRTGANRAEYHPVREHPLVEPG